MRQTDAPLCIAPCVLLVCSLCAPCVLLVCTLCVPQLGVLYPGHGASPRRLQPGGDPSNLGQGNLLLVILHVLV